MKRIFHYTLAASLLILTAVSVRSNGLSGSVYATSSEYEDPYWGFNWEQYGRDWALGLRMNTVTWDEFVSFAHLYLLNAPREARDEFRYGFSAGYGINGGDAFEVAMHHARQWMLIPHDHVYPTGDE